MVILPFLERCIRLGISAQVVQTGTEIGVDVDLRRHFGIFRIGVECLLEIVYRSGVVAFDTIYQAYHAVSHRLSEPVVALECIFVHPLGLVQSLVETVVPCIGLCQDTPGVIVQVPLLMFTEERKCTWCLATQ